MKPHLASFLLAAALSACTPKHASFVRAPRVTLGRVVVYRNGVAFYERHAIVTGGELQISVPRDRLDDFLKSLTVVDARTNEPVPVSIPRQQGAGEDLLMTLQLPNKEPTNVVLTYVTEAPAWKPSYRVAVAGNGKVMLEGWAIVDNTSGEDWKGVIVGVGSSSALSFKYDLWSVREIARETLRPEETFAIAPPVGVAPFGGDKDGGVANDGPSVIGDVSAAEVEGGRGGLTDEELAKLAEQSESQTEEVITVTGSTVDRMPDTLGKATIDPTSTTQGITRDTQVKAKTPAPAPPPPPPLPPAIARIPQRILHSDQTIVINSYTSSDDDAGMRRANNRAEVVKRQLIDAGVAPPRIRLVAQVEAKAAERVQLVAEPAKIDENARARARKAALDADGQPVGESLFTSPTAITVDRGASAMVSMVRGETEGEVVYLYDAETERGNERYAFRAVRFKNPTSSTLESGPVTVYGDERFIGEGLTEPVAPHAAALVPYALDRQVVIDREDSDEDKLAKLVTIQRGTLTAEVQHLKHRRLVTNRLPQVAKVFLRHTVAKGWNLVAAPPRDERVGDSHLFEVDVAPGGKQTVEIAEATPMQRTLDLSVDGTLDMLKLYVDSPIGTPELKAQLDRALAIHKQLADLATKASSLRQQRDEYRERTDELHKQIVSLQAVKAGGALMSHLKDKMRDVSDRVQKATIEIVDAEQQTMLARIQLQDALADMALPDALARR